MNSSKAKVSYQSHHQEEPIGLNEQSLFNFEVEDKYEIYESVEISLSDNDKENARKQIQSAVNKLKEDRDQVKQNLRINFELAKARVTENDLSCSSRANRIGKSSILIVSCWLLASCHYVQKYLIILFFTFSLNSSSNGNGSGH